MIQTRSANVDAYITKFDVAMRDRLEAIRAVIQEEAPQAIESIAYGMPAYKIGDKPLVYFAGFDKHVGLYAMPVAHAAFKDAFAPYKKGKGSVQFPLSDPLPLELIREVVQFRVDSLSSLS